MTSVSHKLAQIAANHSILRRSACDGTRRSPLECGSVMQICQRNLPVQILQEHGNGGVGHVMVRLLLVKVEPLARVGGGWEPFHVGNAGSSRQGGTLLHVEQH